ncbi:MAG: AAA family ATPase [Sphingomonadales bacterium]|nr:AAA family ATPase [Sphingomonadales bacterium]MBD3774588.1 AAA family ATPase [Paracoccaceae bacterium]
MFDDFYQLSGRPFQLTPDPKFYFESATHRKALSYLGYGMAQGEGFIVITGEVGAGKSTLVAHLTSKIDPDQMTVGQIVTSALDGEEMVHVAAQSFGLDIEGHDKASALGAIESFLHDEARAGRRCLLVVDESQNLSVEALEELRMLSNFQLGSHPLLQTLLLGQPEFREVLQRHEELEQLRQRVIANHHLGPMEPAEIEPYIRHRLTCVGWDGNPAIDQRVFAELYQATSGIPRRVNQVMTRLLLLGAVEQRSRIDNAMLTSVLKEMEGDNAFPEAAPQPMPKVERGPAPTPIKHQSNQSQPVAPAESVEHLLAQRDAQIAELQQAVIEVAATDGASSPAIEERLAKIEARLDEQERSIRSALTMMIEFIETGKEPRVAA